MAPFNQIQQRRKFFTQVGSLVLSLLLPGRSNALSPLEPSRTASTAAVQRAVHQILERPVVFNDPLSLQIIGQEKVNEIPLNFELYNQSTAKSLRAHLVARSRLAEDELTRAYANGTRQYIILGAGLDTFAYRHQLSGLRVYEIDHPQTQLWKKKRLKESAILIPQSVDYVSVDFEKQHFVSELKQVPFQFDKPAFVSWLGVTMYLSKETVLNTLSAIAQNFAPGSEIIFDYSLPLEELSERQSIARKQLSEQVKNIGEPWLSHFNTNELIHLMKQMGYKKIDVFMPENINTLYFNNRTDGFKVRGSTRLICASTGS